MGYEKHNGWTNYATWRVNLEIVDDIDWDECENVDADYIEELVEDIVFSQNEENLMSDYARAFLSDVNYYEIAESVNELINEEKEE
jgi:hypothetical protein